MRVRNSLEPRWSQCFQAEDNGISKQKKEEGVNWTPYYVWLVRLLLVWPSGFRHPPSHSAQVARGGSPGNGDHGQPL